MDDPFQPVHWVEQQTGWDVSNSLAFEFSVTLSVSVTSTKTIRLIKDGKPRTALTDSSGAVGQWESRWTSWAVRPNEPSGFRGRNWRFIEPCFGIGHNLSLICQLTSEDTKQHFINGTHNLELQWHVSSCGATVISSRLVELRLLSTETVGLLGTGAQDGHLDFHTAPELCNWVAGFFCRGWVLLYVPAETVRRLIRDGSPAGQPLLQPVVIVIAKDIRPDFMGLFR